MIRVVLKAQTLQLGDRSAFGVSAKLKYHKSEEFVNLQQRNV